MLTIQMLFESSVVKSSETEKFSDLLKFILEIILYIVF